MSSNRETVLWIQKETARDEKKERVSHIDRKVFVAITQFPGGRAYREPQLWLVKLIKIIYFIIPFAPLSLCGECE